MSYLWSFILIFSSQYLNDSTLKNIHWALCTGVFGKRDVGRIEREYLEVLNFELGVSEADLLSHHQGLLDATRPAPRFTHHNSPRSLSMGPHVSRCQNWIPHPLIHHRRHLQPSHLLQWTHHLDHGKNKLAPRKLITPAHFQALTVTMDLPRSFPIPRLTTTS